MSSVSVSFAAAMLCVGALGTGTARADGPVGGMALPSFRLNEEEDVRSANGLFSAAASPFIRIVVSDGLDRATLRAIDEMDAAESKRSDPFATVWRSRSPADWIGGNDSARNSRTLLFREDGGAFIRPVRGFRIPNPLALLGNPARWGGRFRGEYGDNFDDLTRIRGNLIVSAGLPIGFDTEFIYWQDDVNRGAMTDFWSGDFNLVYRFGKVRNVEFRAGIGVNWLAGDSTDIGLNSTYGFDIYLKKPWIISTSVDWGKLGAKSLLHARVTAGLDLGRFELYAGYDFYEIGSRERKGLVAGVGMWF